MTVSGAALFLTGLPRSGTTWVGRVLTADPHVFRIDEPFNPKTRQWLPIDYPSRYLEPDVPLVIPAALRRAVDGMLNLRFRVPRQPELRNRRQLVRDLGALSRFVEAKARRSTVVVKDPTANFLAAWLHDEFGARPVVLVRHPCGNAAGYLRMGWSGLPYLERPGPAAQFRPSDRTYVEPYRHAVAGDPILSAALDWRLTNGMLLGWRERVPDLVVVRYEELADDPATSFPSLAGRLGLPWGRHNEVTLDELRGAAVDHAALGSKLHVMNREPRAAAWSWRDRLAKDQIDAVLEHAGPLAAELGYGP